MKPHPMRRLILRGASTLALASATGIGAMCNALAQEKASGGTKVVLLGTKGGPRAVADGRIHQPC
jgi:hypothetical protein